MKLVLIMNGNTIPADVFAEVAERIGAERKSEPVSCIHLYGQGEYDTTFIDNLNEWFPGATRIYHKADIGVYERNVADWKRIVLQTKRNIRDAECTVTIVCEQYPEKLWYAISDAIDYVIHFERIEPNSL